jgi:hypothetical protein
LRLARAGVLMSPARSRLARAGGLLVALWLMAPRPAHATAEEFSTFSVERQEEDDESALDHLLTRLPRDWRAEWERAPLAFRTSEGCLTSGQWFVLTDLKLETALGKRATLGLDYVQRRDNTVSFDDLALHFRFPIRAGRIAVDFHPSYDKSRQDFALTWDTGPDTSSLYVMVRFTIEDMLNNLWAWRQSRVGEQSEPYLRHPFQPEAAIISRHDHWRAEAGGRYLTPSEKQVMGYYTYSPPRIQTLWGTLGWAALEAQTLGLDLETRGENKQALSTDQVTDYSSGDTHDFRRQWSAEVSAARELKHVRVLARWLYQARTEVYGPPPGPGRFDGLDRIAQLEVSHRFATALSARAGALYDRVAFSRSGTTPYTSEPREKESRAYVGLEARFGKVSVEGVEGIELDAEPYQVVWHHDKGFLKLQCTF